MILYNSGSIWDHFEVTLGLLLAYEGDLGATLGSFRDHFGHIDVDLAGLMRIVAGLVGLKSTNVEKVLVL